MNIISNNNDDDDDDDDDGDYSTMRPQPCHAQALVASAQISVHCQNAFKCQRYAAEQHVGGVQQAKDGAASAKDLTRRGACAQPQPQMSVQARNKQHPEALRTTHEASSCRYHITQTCTP